MNPRNIRYDIQTLKDKVSLRRYDYFDKSYFRTIWPETIRFTSDQKINIKITNPSVKLEVDGEISGSTIEQGDVMLLNSSDERLKDNIIQIENPLEKMESIGGYTEFDWNNNQQIYHGHDIGVINTRNRKKFYLIVKDRGSGYKGVQYDKIIPLLIESIKELKQKVEDIEKIVIVWTNRFIFIYSNLTSCNIKELYSWILKIQKLQRLNSQMRNYNLSQIWEIHTETVQNDFETLRVQKVVLTQQLDNLENPEEQVELKYIDTQRAEQELVKTLNEKYGPGNLDPQTGVFTPISEG